MDFINNTNTTIELDKKINTEIDTIIKTKTNEIKQKYINLLIEKIKIVRNNILEKVAQIIIAQIIANNKTDNAFINNLFNMTTNVFPPNFLKKVGQTVNGIIKITLDLDNNIIDSMEEIISAEEKNLPSYSITKLKPNPTTLKQILLKEAIKTFNDKYDSRDEFNEFKDYLSEVINIDNKQYNNLCQNLKFIIFNDKNVFSTPNTNVFPVNSLNNFCANPQQNSLPNTKTQYNDNNTKTPDNDNTKTQYNDNMYEILELDQTATNDEIKAAFRKKALKYHPDRNITKTNTEKEEAERIFKLASNAYQILADPIERAKYDKTLPLTKKRGGKKTKKRKTKKRKTKKRYLSYK